MAYGEDYKKAAVAYKLAGHTFKQLREVFDIPAETYYKWLRQYESGDFRNKYGKIRRRKIDREKLRQAVADKPDSFLRELAEQFECTPQAIFSMLRNMGITLKKKPSATASDPSRRDPSFRRR